MGRRARLVINVAGIVLVAVIDVVDVLLCVVVVDGWDARYTGRIRVLAMFA